MSTRDLQGTRRIVFVCLGSSCRKEGAEEVLHELKHGRKAHGLSDTVHVVRARCLGRCEDACNVLVTPDQCWYGAVGVRAARRILAEHLATGTPVADHLTYAPRDGALVQVGGSRKGKHRTCAAGSAP